MAMLTQEELDTIDSGVEIYWADIGELRTVRLITSNFRRTESLNYFRTKKEADQHVQLNGILDKLKEK